MNKQYFWIPFGVSIAIGTIIYGYQVQQQKDAFLVQSNLIKNKLLKYQSTKTQMTKSLPKNNDIEKAEYIIIRGSGRVEKFNAELRGQMANVERSRPSRLRYNLAKNLVLEMASKGTTLKSQARFKKEATGWRVQLLRDNTIFHKAGFQNNDLILFEDLRQISDAPGEKHKLNSRMKALFDQLSD